MTFASIPASATVFLDANTLIYHFANDPKYGAACTQLIKQVELQQLHGFTSAHVLGWPDSGTSMRDMLDNARRIVMTVDIPVFCDMDTGYGDAISVYRTVQEYIRAGIAGAHLEDQTFPPKSGPRRPARPRGLQEAAQRVREKSKSGSQGAAEDQGSETGVVAVAENQ